MDSTPAARGEEEPGPLLGRGGRPRALLRLVVQYLTFRTANYLILNLLVFGWPAALLSVWLAARFLDRRHVRDFGLRRERGWWSDFAFGLLLGAALMTGVFGAEIGFDRVSVAGAFETVGTGVPFALALLFPLAAFLCVGFYEELVSRGYQIRNAAEGLSGTVGPRAAVLLAWVLSSAFFGLLHARNPNATVLSTLNISLAGIMLGLGYVLTGRLAIPVGLHITWYLFQSTV